MVLYKCSLRDSRNCREVKESAAMTREHLGKGTTEIIFFLLILPLSIGIEFRVDKPGSIYQPLTEGKVRLYGMRFCPYAQRVNLVLEAKKIPYEVVYINLIEKPDWYQEVNPLGKVPSLETKGGDCIYESLVVADYLDETYPQHPLHSQNPMQKAKDRILIELFSKVTQILYKLYKIMETELFENLLSELDNFEKELLSRHQHFYGGDQPGMVDYMIWPWFEKIAALMYLGGNGFILPKERFPELVTWKYRMQTSDAVKALYLDPEIQAKFLKTWVDGKPDYNLWLH